MSVKLRQELERKIASRLIRDALAAGYSLSVYDGEEVTVKTSRKHKEILGAMFSTDEDHLLFHKEVTGEPRVEAGFGVHITNVDSGWVKFVYGNDGYDVISDYTTNLEHIMTGANKISDKYS